MIGRMSDGHVTEELGDRRQHEHLQARSSSGAANARSCSPVIEGMATSTEPAP